MPIYEYKCDDCGKDFEELVFGPGAVKCPACGSGKTAKKMSAFGMSGVEKPFAGDSSCSKPSCSSKKCSSCG
jgi:putative FmdB family regulatory protein